MNDILASANQPAFSLTEVSTNNAVWATIIYILFMAAFFGLSTWGCKVYGKVRKIYSNILLWSWGILFVGLGIPSFASYVRCFPHSTQTDMIKATSCWMVGLVAGGVLTIIYRRKKGIKDADQVWMEEQRVLANAPLLVRVKAARKQIWITFLCSIGMVMVIPASAGWGARHGGAGILVALAAGMHTFRRSYELIYIALAVVGNWAAFAKYLSLREQERAERATGEGKGA